MEIHRFQDFYIPVRGMEALKLWIEEGIATGSFLTSVLKNNLKQAVMYADDENIRNIPAYVEYLYNNAPMNCWGSEELFEQWKESHAKIRSEKMKGGSNLHGKGELNHEQNHPDGSIG